MGWSNNNYRPNGINIILLNHGFYDLSTDGDIERDFSEQLRTEISNANVHEKIAIGHRMGSYMLMINDLRISPREARFYTLANQKDLCERNILTTLPKRPSSKVSQKTADE